jgi:5-methylcytosine-specific restriction endonuclease McrA
MTDSRIAFATRLLELVHRFSTTSSYKHALLCALIELSCEARGRGASGSASFTTRELTERMVALYWQHATAWDERGALDQIGGRRRSIVHAIAALRALDERRTTTPLRAKTAFPSEYRQLLDDVEYALIRFPLRLLQRLDGEHVELLYLGWSREWSESIVRRYQRQFAGGPATREFDNRVILLPDVHLWLAELAPLFLPLIRREWAALVAQRNRLADAHLHAFLFAPSREQLVELRPELARMQAHCCFYCGEPLRSHGEVDHFLAWSRCSTSSVENLVVAHAACNNDKSDALVVARHLERWFARLEQRRDDLAELAAARRWASEPLRMRALVHGSYVDLPAELRLWAGRKQWRRAGDEPLARVLARHAVSALAPS